MGVSSLARHCFCFTPPSPTEDTATLTGCGVGTAPPRTKLQSEYHRVNKSVMTEHHHIRHLACWLVGGAPTPSFLGTLGAGNTREDGPSCPGHVPNTSMGHQCRRGDSCCVSLTTGSSLEGHLPPLGKKGGMPSRRGVPVRPPTLRGPLSQRDDPRQGSSGELPPRITLG